MPKKIEIKGPIITSSSDWVYRWLGMEYASPKKLKEDLEAAGNEDIVIEINSSGGVCAAGMEMYQAIMEYQGNVTGHVIVAASAATLPACAADKTLMSDAAIFMIHNTQSSASGDYRDMQMSSDALREFNEGLINAYVRKTGLSRDEIQTLMDNDTYMSPQTAIEKHFADGYICGDPNRTEQTADINIMGVVAAATAPAIIPEDKLLELASAIKQIEEKNSRPDNKGVAPVQPQNTGENAVSDTPTNSKGGNEKMTLNEFLKENPEAQTEMDAMLATREKEGADAERNRIQSLDKLAKTVSAEMLDDAKYGENQLDGPALAYKALAEGNKIAESYMSAAEADANDSGVRDVGTGKPDTGETDNTTDEDEMAAYVNQRKGR